MQLLRKYRGEVIVGALVYCVLILKDLLATLLH